ncbi:MAG: DNA repair protein RecN [Firmicutes bacterium]|nr:DNA repair protein RecN [Bacillota bacterium]
MLQSLTIENIAVIRHAKLEGIPPGFVVMTGETGAGKSIVIDAINAVLGERTSRDLIRTGADSARVTALFSEASAEAASLLEGLDLPVDENGDIILSRAITLSGKNSCRVNGVPVTVAALRQVGGALVNIHGQHDSQALLDPARHVGFIDAMAENADLREEYKAAYLHLRSLQKEQSALQMDENEKARRLDMLRHQVAELEQAEIVPGERAALLEKQALLRNSEKILEALRAAGDALAGGASLSGGIEFAGASALAFEAAGALERAGEFSPAAQALAETARAAAYELDECAGELRGLLESAAFDPAGAEAVERRLDVYYRLSRKYGTEEAEMLAFLEKARDEEASITRSDERILELEEIIEEQKAVVIQLARALSKSRRETGEIFTRAVREELLDLDMPNVRIEARSEKIPLTQEGGEQMEFLISANPGEAPRPLAKIASGGELSRVMLAIKSVLAQKDPVCTLIFDEIDAGVSGRAAQKIGRKLRRVAGGRQVVCVTHLAQIAALADCHLLIEKQTDGGSTETHIRELGRSERVGELARIMGGEGITRAQMAAAEEMLTASPAA